MVFFLKVLFRWGGKKDDMKKNMEELSDEIMERNLKLAQQFLVDKVKKNISISTKSKGPSKPGEFPHLDTGKLRQSIVGAVDSDGNVTVGSNVSYALELENGTPDKPARPFIKRTMAENAKKIEKIMTKKK